MTNRREFLKKSTMAVAAVAVAPILSASVEPCKPTNMKKIMLIDGGPRRNMNTAAMAEAFAEGARSAGSDVKYVRLYDIDYKGCRSCMACQLKVTEHKYTKHFWKSTFSNEFSL